MLIQLAQETGALAESVRPLPSGLGLSGAVLGGAILTQAYVVIGVENPQRIPFLPVVLKHWKTCALVLAIKWVLGVAMFFGGGLLCTSIFPQFQAHPLAHWFFALMAGVAPAAASQSIRSVRRSLLARQASRDSATDEEGPSEINRVLNHATEVFLVRMAQAIAEEARMLMAKAYEKYGAEVFNLAWEKHITTLEQGDRTKNYSHYRNPFQKANTLCRELSYKNFIKACEEASSSLRSLKRNGLHESRFRNVVGAWDGRERRTANDGHNRKRRKCDRLVDEVENSVSSG